MEGGLYEGGGGKFIGGGGRLIGGGGKLIGGGGNFELCWEGGLKAGGGGRLMLLREGGGGRLMLLREGGGGRLRLFSEGGRGRFPGSGGRSREGMGSGGRLKSGGGGGRGFPLSGGGGGRLPPELTLSALVFPPLLPNCCSSSALAFLKPAWSPLISSFLTGTGSDAFFLPPKSSSSIFLFWLKFSPCPWLLFCLAGCFFSGSGSSTPSFCFLFLIASSSSWFIRILYIQIT